MVPILGFITCTLVILYCGKKLSFYGDIISYRSGLGKAWVGLILLSTVTSLPELMVGISSSAIVQSADLAVSDVLGSCAFNLGLLAMLDAFMPKQSALFSTASQKHVLAAVMGIILVAMAGIGIFLPDEMSIIPFIGITSILFIVIYLWSIRLLYLYERKTAVIETKDEKYDEGGISLKKAIQQFVFFALITVGAALFLPYLADQIAEMTHLGKSFVGTLFLATSTSLPEIAVSIAAVRMGSLDLAVGNLFGSSIFNIVILSIDDIFYTKGRLLKDASDANMISIFAVIIMSAIAIVGLTYRSGTKRYKLAWDSALIFLVYIVNLIVLYRLTSL